MLFIHTFEPEFFVSFFLFIFFLLEEKLPQLMCSRIRSFHFQVKSTENCSMAGCYLLSRNKSKFFLILWFWSFGKVEILWFLPQGSFTETLVGEKERKKEKNKIMVYWCLLIYCPESSWSPVQRVTSSACAFSFPSLQFNNTSILYLSSSKSKAIGIFSAFVVLPPILAL